MERCQVKGEKGDPISTSSPREGGGGKKGRLQFQGVSQRCPKGEKQTTAFRWIGGKKKEAFQGVAGKGKRLSFGRRRKREGGGSALPSETSSYKRGREKEGTFSFILQRARKERREKEAAPDVKNSPIAEKEF